MTGSFTDVTNRVVLSLTGAKSLDFLQRISTNDVASVRSGRSVQTVLTNEKGKIIDVVTIVPRGNEAVLLPCQLHSPERLISWLDKFIVMEDIRVRDITSSLRQFVPYDLDLIGVKELLYKMSSRATATEETLGFATVHHVFCQTEKAQLKDFLLNQGLLRASSGGCEKYRVVSGIPGINTELSDQFNPLEANLASLISWTKGCYIGQEVIARLDTYKKVQRRLVTVKLADLPETLPTFFSDEDGEAGVITSCLRAATTGEYRGLGYLRSTHMEKAATYFFLEGEARVTIEIIKKPI